MDMRQMLLPAAGTASGSKAEPSQPGECRNLA